MALGYNQERTETATPRRRELARKEGQVARSREAVSAILFIGTILFFSFGGSALARQLLNLTKMTLSSLDGVEMSQPGFYLVLTRYLSHAALMVVPLLLTLFGLAFGSSIIQTGFLFSFKALEPNLSRLNPLQGLQRIFSLQSVNDLFKSLVKIGIVGYILYVTIQHEMGRAVELSGQDISSLAAYLGRSSLRLCTRAAYAIAIMAILDYAFQRWQFSKSLRMSRQEVKDEKKQEEGDPQLKARIRSIMRQMAQRRMMEDVPNADVIVTNPTHLAVALQYKSQEMPAPKVLAKGAGHVAERIKAVAQEHDIPIIENKPVAQSLFKTVEIGAFIPETLYRAVAEILSYVYQIRPQNNA